MDGEITIGTKLDTKEFDRQIEQLEKDLKQMERSYETGTKLGFKEDKEDLEKLSVQIEKTKNKLISLRQQKEKATNSGDVNQLVKGFKDFGNSIQSSIGKVAKLALGIFGIRSAYMALRRASSDLASYDQQYATNLEYIRYALTMAVAPVLRYIVNLAATLLQYINMILNALFGINIFSRGSAESFNKMKAGAGGALKAVKEIKKQLAGFDEINMLTDQSDTGTAGGAGGVGMPSFDLSTFNIKQPKWLDWLVKNKKNILSLFGGIAGFLVTFKLGLGALLSLGVGVALYGIIEAVQGLLAFMKNPTWENFKKFLGGLAVAITGVAIAMIAFNATNPVGWILLAIGVVVALATKIADLTQKYIANKKGTLDLKNAKEALKKAEEDLANATDEYIEAVDNANEAQKNLTEAEKRNKMSGRELYEQVKNGTLDYKDMTDAQKEVYKAYVNNEKAQGRLKTATENYIEAQKEQEKQSYNMQLATLLEAKEYDKLKESVVQAYKDGKISAGEARDYIEQAMKDMDETSAQVFLQDIPDNIKEGINPDKYKGNWYNFKKKWNEFVDSLKKEIKVRFEGIFKPNVEGFSGGSHGFAKGGIVYHNLPKLGIGGIINQPRKRSSIKWSNSWGKRSRRGNSINRQPTNGITRTNNRKIYCCKCQYSKYHER